MKYYLIYIKDKIKIYFKNNGKRLIKNIGIQLLFLCLVIGIIAPISIYIYNNEPRRYLSSSIVIENIDTLYYDPRNMTTFDNMTSVPNIYLNPHTHTTYSDGKLSPELAIKYHIANGYNVAFITDHNRINGSLEAEKIAKEKYSDKLLVLPGIEWTNCRCHLGLIGIREDVKLIKWPTNQQIKEIIDQVHSKGGFVILNHYPWSFLHGLDQPTMEEWLDMGIDFLEVVNEETLDYQGLLFAKKNNLRYVTGVDLHLETRATAWTVFNIPSASQLSRDQPISSVVPSLTQNLVLETLKNKSTQTSFLFDAKGSTIHANAFKSKLNPQFEFLSPWIYTGQFFHSFYDLKKGMYSFVDGSCTDQQVVVYSNQLLSLVAWLLILFLICQIVYLSLKEFYKFIFRKFNHNKNHKNQIKDFESNYNNSYSPTNSDTGSVNSDEPLKKNNKLNKINNNNNNNNNNNSYSNNNNNNIEDNEYYNNKLAYDE